LIGGKTEKALIELAKREALGDYVLLENCIPLVEDLVRGIEQRFKEQKSRNDVKHFLADRLSSEERLLGIWVGFEPGAFDGKDGQNKGENHSDKNGRFVPYCYRDDKGEINTMPLEEIEKEEFYSQPRENKKITILKPFRFEIEGEKVLMTTVAKPIYNKVKFIGVTGVDIRLKIAKEIFEDILYFKTGLGSASTGELKQMASRGGKRGKKVLSQVVQVLISNQKEIMAEIQKAAEAIWEASEKIAGSTEGLSASTESQAGSVEELTATMQEMGASIQEVADNIQKTSENAEKVSGSIIELNRSLNEVDQNVETIAGEVDAVKDAAEEMEKTSAESSGKTRETNQEMQKTLAITQEGKEYLQKTVTEMEGINQLVGQMAGAAEELGGSAGKIGEIVELIDDIAEQTNLLALNASIEAARAGEHGKGFAVVASAISDLADRSQEATGDIGHLIKRIQKEVESAVETSRKGSDRVKQGSQIVMEAGEAFAHIHGAVNDVTEKMGEITRNIEGQNKQSIRVKEAIEKINSFMEDITTSTQKQVTNTEEVVTMVEKMADLAREVAAASEEQSASSDEVVKTVENVSKDAEENARASEEIADSGDDLRGLSKDLLTVLKQFAVE